MAEEDLNPNISELELSTEVVANREAQAAADILDEAVLEPRMAAHRTAYRLALDTVDHFHRHVAEATDLDLVGLVQRPAAVWQMAGRSIGLSRGCLDMSELGYCAEVIPLGRTLHEANRLLQTFASRDEDELLKIWLADEGRYKWVKPKQAREAIDRTEEKLDAIFKAAELPEINRTAELSDQLYDQLSRASHNRRAWVQDAVAAPLRLMATGPHPTPIRRAGTLASIGGTIEEAVQSVGDAFGDTFYGRGFWTEHIRPHIKSFEALRETQPLT